MNNWHRRIFKLNPINPGQFIKDLFDANLTNVFWFEPYIPVDTNGLRFRVQSQPSAMAGIWLTVTPLEPLGTNPFTGQAAVDDDTERLEGTITIEVPLRFRVFLDNNSMPPKLLLAVGELGGGGSGMATGQDN